MDKERRFYLKHITHICDDNDLKQTILSCLALQKQCTTLKKKKTSFKHRPTSSLYFGVHKQNNHFVVQVKQYGIKYYGGSYCDEKVAAWASTQLSVQVRGIDNAWNNHIELEEYEFINNRAIKNIKAQI